MGMDIDVEDGAILKEGNLRFYYGANLIVNEEMCFRFSVDGETVATYPFSELGTDDEGAYAENLVAGIGKLFHQGILSY